MAYSIYDTTTGMFLRGSKNPHANGLDQLTDPSEAVWPAYWDDLHYYVNLTTNEVDPRPWIIIPESRSIIGDDEDLFIIDYVPEGTRIIILDMSVPKTDPEYQAIHEMDGTGVFEWSNTRLGHFRFVFDPPLPWKRLEFAVEVIAS